MFSSGLFSGYVGLLDQVKSSKSVALAPLLT